MKTARKVMIVVSLIAVAASGWAAGQKETGIQGPPYNVQTVMRILSNEQLYQQGYLQREVDKNGDGLSDETGQRIYVGALRDFRDANGDGVDDATGGVLPLGMQNRLLDRNGDGTVDGTSEPVGQYVNRVRIEAQQRYEQGEADGDQLQVQTQTQSREQSQTSTEAQSGSGGSSQQRSADSGRSR